MKNKYKMKAYLPVLFLVLTFASCDREADKHENSVRPVKYEKVSYTYSKNTHTYPGIVKAESETKLSFKVGGTINTVNVKLGNKVNKGALIASIDPVDYTIQKEQAVAQKNSAESQLINARSAFDRVEKLYENNSVALNEYEKAKTSLVSAESQFNAASKQLEAATNQVNYTRLYAPVEGIITSLSIEADEVVGAGRVVAVLSSRKNPEVEVGVPEVVINNLKEAQPVNIVIPSLSDQTYKGHINKVAFASGTAPTYLVNVSIDTLIDSIRPGMAADVTFIQPQSGTTNKLLAPAASVGKDVEGNYVFVLHKEDSLNYKVEKRTVCIGKLLQEGFEINNGLNENELVATAGLSFLRDGMTVRLLNK